RFGLLRQRFPARNQPKIMAEPGGIYPPRVAVPMAYGLSVARRVGIMRMVPSIGKNLPAEYVTLSEAAHAARDVASSLLRIVDSDSRSCARHAMHVGIEALLGASFLDQLGRPRLVRHGILQRSGDIDELARDLRIVALCTAVESVFPAPHSGEIRFSVG